MTSSNKKSNDWNTFVAEGKAETLEKDLQISVHRARAAVRDKEPDNLESLEDAQVCPFQTDEDMPALMVS